MLITEEKHIKINEEKWDKWADSLDSKSLRYDFLRKCQRDVISLLDLKDNIRILDIGCGTGYALAYAAKLIDGKGSFYGVDLSAKMIEKAKENFKENENFHFINSNAESIPLDNNLFDIIICTNSFHHYLHPDKALKEMKRLLFVGGRLYILDPTMDSLFFKFIGTVIKVFEHTMVKLYSTKEFENFMVGAGLKYVGTKIIKNHQKVHIGEKI